MITASMPLARVHAYGFRNLLFFAPVVLAVACSGSDDIDFFDSSDDTGGTAAGGSSGTAGSETGGSTTGGSTSGGSANTGGASGNGKGGSGSETTGGTGAETGGTGAEGGTGTGGTDQGGTNQGGDAGGGAGPMGGTAGGGTSGGAGKGTGGAGMGGTAMGGAGMGGTGGAGMGGAGTGGSGMAGAGGCVPTVPATERCDGIDNNCSGGIDEGNTCPDNCTGATRSGHTYLFCSFEGSGGAGNRLRNWMQAQDFCTQRGTSLVFIESAEENTFVLEWIEKMALEDQVWMGANDRDALIGPSSNEGTWVWGTANNAVQFWDGDENGDPVMNRYEDWATGEPNNMGNEDCAVFSADHTYHWDDRMCANTYPNFVCESAASITTN